MKDLLYVLKFLGTLPFWIRATLYLLLSAIVVAVAGYWGKHSAIIAAIVCLVIAILLIILARLSQWVRERKAAELRGEGLEFGVPSSLVDTDLLERISDLRRDFTNGIHKFQVFGKDLYEMPWFILVGEHGSGKSEAIIHSKVDLPRDLQNKEQAPEASAQLNWWFTNFGVILDTKGDMVFRADSSETTPEWNELLELLKKNRTNCPANGIIVAIPADSLLRDSRKEIDRKAGVVARHFDRLQKSLGVKLPVYVLVTKCDLIEGFLSFFDNLKDPKLQQQMLGWSNPAPLEAPFRPELFVDFMQSLVQRLRRIRLALMSNPVPQSGMQRRIDEVDGFYRLPDNIQSIISPLRSFIEDIFVPRQWAASPLFLRGVYLTSACPSTDESAINSEAPVTKTSSDISWYNKTSYFLREVFLAKIFREDGLVTITGTDRQKQLRYRTLIFLGCLFIMLFAIFRGISVWRLTDQTIKPNLGYWNRATIGWSDKGYFSPIIASSDQKKNELLFKGNDPIGYGPIESQGKTKFHYPEITTTDYLTKIAILSQESFKDHFVGSAPIYWFVIETGETRKRVARVLFEASVIKPLLDETRKKMTRRSASDAEPVQAKKAPDADHFKAIETKALTELIMLETAVVQHSELKTNYNGGVTFIPSLLEYTCGKTNDTRLVNLMNWTYLDNPEGVGQWAPTWMSGGSSLESNRAINEGIERLVKNSKSALDQFQNKLSLIQQMADAATAYYDAETKLSQACGAKANPGKGDTAAQNAYQNLRTAKTELEQKINLLKSSGLFNGGPATLSSAVELLKTGEDSYFGAVNSILADIQQSLPASQTNQIAAAQDMAQQVAKVMPVATVITSALDKTTNALSLFPSETSNKYLLFNQINAKLQDISKMIASKVDAAINDKLLSSYQTLDSNLFLPYQGKPSYEWRWDAYELSVKPNLTAQYDPSMYLVGQQWIQMGEMVASVDQILAKIDAYNGPYNDGMQTICDYFLGKFRDTQIGLFVNNYVKQGKDALLRVARFPLVWPPGTDNQALDVNQLVAAKGLLDAIGDDIQSTNFTSLSMVQQQPALDFTSKLSPLYGVVDALILPNGSAARVSVTLFNGQAQKQLSGPNYAPLPTPSPTPTPPPRSTMSKLFFDIGSTPTPPPLPEAGVVSTMNWNALELVGAGGGGVYPLDSQTDITLGTFSVQEPFNFQVYHTLMASDGTVTVDGGENWSALRLIAKLGGTRVGVGQDWRISLMPDQPNGVWVKFSFELPLPPTPWPTLESLNLRTLPGQ